MKMHRFEIVLHANFSDEQTRIQVDALDRLRVRLHPRVQKIIAEDFSILDIREIVEEK
jgi:hypothetical protein